MHVTSTKPKMNIDDLTNYGGTKLSAVPWTVSEVGVGQTW
jgi:hypothetical protein